MHSARENGGVARRALIPGLRVATLFTMPLVAIFLAAGAALGTLHHPGNVLATFGGLFVWGTSQQWILQTHVGYSYLMLDGGS